MEPQLATFSFCFLKWEIQVCSHISHGAFALYGIQYGHRMQMTHKCVVNPTDKRSRRAICNGGTVFP